MRQLDQAKLRMLHTAHVPLNVDAFAALTAASTSQSLHMATTEPGMNKFEMAEAEKLTSVAELQNTTNAARLKLISLFCNVVYSWEDENAAAQLIEDCLKVCGGSKELLAKVLQTRFIDKRTPLRWIICNIGQHQVTELPPLPKALLDHCGPSLSPEAIDDIERACCDRNDNTMLRAALAHRLFRRVDTLSFEMPVIDVINSNELAFRMPNFLDRMLMANRCSVDVIFHNALYRVTVHSFTVDETWLFVFARLKTCAKQGVVPAYAQLWLAEVDAEGAPQAMKKVQDIGEYDAHLGSIAIEVDLLRKRNSFIGKNRQLSGKLEITEWRRAE